jgi:hypothetical protein
VFYSHLRGLSLLNNKEKMKRKTYKTDDFYLSCFLLGSGIEIQAVEPFPQNENKFIFCFFNTEQLQKLREEYLTSKAKISPSDYETARRKLKSIIYSDRIEN